MRVYVEIVDSRTGIYQMGMIDEPVIEGFEIQNALSHFGVDSPRVVWETYSESEEYSLRVGKVEDTTKIVTVIILL